MMMTMKSQLDPNVYGKAYGGGSSIGEVLSAVNGVTSIVGKAKERKATKKEEDENEYLNTKFGEKLNGWNGQDQNDFLNRINTAAGEVLTEKPELYSKVTPQIGAAVKAVRDAEDQQMQKESKILENAGKTTSNQSAEQDLFSKKIENRKKAQQFLIDENDLITKFLDVDNAKDYEFGKTYLNGRLGVTPNVPDSFEEFAPNKAAFLNKAQMEKQRLEKEMNDLKLSSEKSGVSAAKSAATIAGVNAEYIRREKEQGLLKGEADINKKNLAITINDLNDEEQSSLANAIQNGFDPYKINSKNAKIIAHLDRDTGGKVKWNTAAANAIYERSIGTQNTQSILTTIDPLLENLKIKGKELGNTGFPLLNRGVNAAKEATGNPAIVAFNNARDDAIAELERGLLGTGVLSDSKYMRALKNVNSAQSYPQLEAAVGQMKIAISSRLEAVDKQTRRPAGLEPGEAESQRGERLAPKGIQAGESFTHKNGVVITREK